MGTQMDRKLHEVAVAWYPFRHEAEFAAGFLEDAGIPFRMQVDDPVLGSGVVGNATIWVLGMHEPLAREVLDLDGAPAYLTRESRLSRHPRDTLARASAGGPGRARPPMGPRPTSGAHQGRSGTARALSVRERVLALLGGTTVLASLRLYPEDPLHPIVSAGAFGLAALLSIAFVAGWAPAPLHRLLRAMSGGAP
jgi:hypothetical protein